MKSLSKALEILKIFLDVGDELSLAEVARISKLNKTTVYRILSTLVKHKYLRQPKKKGEYSLGTIYLNFSDVIKRKLKLRNIAIPYLIELNQRVNELVKLASVDGTTVVFLEAINKTPSSNNILQIFPIVPTDKALHCTGSGKIILANMADAELEKYFATKWQHPFTLNTITDRHEMVKQLNEIRKEGVAYDDEEFCLGVRGMAVGIKDARDVLIGTIDLVAPTVRLSYEAMKELAPLVKNASLQISREMGYEDRIDVGYLPVGMT